MESLRALAALAVLFAHIVGTARTGHIEEALGHTPERLLYAGGQGVFLFFALSGFLLFWPFAKRAFADGRKVDLARYARNRALRILPLYVVVMSTVLWVQEDGSSPRHWLLFMTMTENFAADTVGQINPVVWSVVIEVQFYVLLPLIAWLLTRVSRGSLARAALALGALALASFALRYFLYLDASAPNDRIGRFSLPSTFYYFVAGMLVALLRVRLERRPAPLQGWLASSNAWIILSIGLWILVAATFTLPEAWNGMEAVAALASALLVGGCVLPLADGVLVRLLDCRVLAAIGIWSYSLYLWHVPILTWMEDQKYAFVTHLGVVAAVALPLVVAWSMVSYWLIERPFLSRRTRWASTMAVHDELGRKRL